MHEVITYLLAAGLTTCGYCSERDTPTPEPEPAADASVERDFSGPNAKIYEELCKGDDPYPWGFCRELYGKLKKEIDEGNLENVRDLSSPTSLEGRNKK